jgi:hypothetical protein
LVTISQFVAQISNSTREDNRWQIDTTPKGATWKDMLLQAETETGGASREPAAKWGALGALKPHNSFHQGKQAQGGKRFVHRAMSRIYIEGFEEQPRTAADGSGTDGSGSCR